MKFHLVLYTFLRLWLKYKQPGWFFSGLFISALAFTRRHKPGSVIVGGQRVNYIDGPSAYSSFEAIWLEEIYKFECKKDSAVIFDCGANIGMSVLYFKARFPASKVVAFEPDNNIYPVLVNNCKGLKSVEIRNEAVWTEGTSLKFLSTSDDGGKVVSHGSETDEVKAIRLRDEMLSYHQIDLLKIDIEGAELSVLRDIKGELSRVERVFVEYHQFEGEHNRLNEVLNLLCEAGFDVHIQPEFYSSSPFWNINVNAGMVQRINVMGFRCQRDS